MGLLTSPPVTEVGNSHFGRHLPVAQQYQVSERTVERWVERGLEAQKATEEQLWQLLREKRLKGLPPKGVWLIERSGLGRLASIRKPVGYPKGKARSKHS